MLYDGYMMLYDGYMMLYDGYMMAQICTDTTPLIRQVTSQVWLNKQIE